MRLGVDLGGTKIEGVALDGSREVVRLRYRTPQHDYDGTIAAIVELVAALEHYAQPGPLHGSRPTVGVGIPGTVSAHTGLVKNANSTWLIGRPLQEDLERALSRPVRIANDANCFTVSEATDGAAAGAGVVFGVIVGTGTGGGVVIHGRIVAGLHGIAGEWGHNPLPWLTDDERPGPPCYCGKHGCIETFLSGPGLARDYSRQGSLHDVTPEHVVLMAQQGVAEAEAALVRYEQRMARALASIINVLDPDVIVLGGGLSNVSRLYDQVPRYWRDYVFAAGPAEQVRTRLVPAAHGDASGVRGAAWLWD